MVSDATFFLADEVTHSLFLVYWVALLLRLRTVNFLFELFKLTLEIKTATFFLASFLVV